MLTPEEAQAVQTIAGLVREYIGECDHGANVCVCRLNDALETVARIPDRLASDARALEATEDRETPHLWYLNRQDVLDLLRSRA